MRDGLPLKPISHGSAIASEPDIAADARGDFLVAWLTAGQSLGWHVQAVMYLVDGTTRSRFWGTLDLAGMVTAPHVAMSPDGSMGLVGWVDNGNYKTCAATFNPARKAGPKP